jgi:hypothetical protein
LGTGGTDGEETESEAKAQAREDGRAAGETRAGPSVIPPVNAAPIAPSQEISSLQMWARLPIVLMEAWLAPFKRQG